MRFMLRVYPGGFDEAGPDFASAPEAVAPMMKFNEEPQYAGVLLTGCTWRRSCAVTARRRLAEGYARAAMG